MNLTISLIALHLAAAEPEKNNGWEMRKSNL
jgi:hypothetical protein